jgi:hypothetical protein
MGEFFSVLDKEVVERGKIIQIFIDGRGCLRA